MPWLISNCIKFFINALKLNQYHHYLKTKNYINNSDKSCKSHVTFQQASTDFYSRFLPCWWFYYHQVIVILIWNSKFEGFKCSDSSTLSQVFALEINNYEQWKVIEWKYICQESPLLKVVIISREMQLVGQSSSVHWNS